MRNMSIFEGVRFGSLCGWTIKDVKIIKFRIVFEGRAVGVSI